MNTHQRALQRTNLEVMSRKTNRPPRVFSTAKTFAKDASVCLGGHTALSPKDEEEEEDWGYFEGQPLNTTTGVYWERGRAQIHSHYLPLSAQPGETCKACPHDVIRGSVSKSRKLFIEFLSDKLIPVNPDSQDVKQKGRKRENNTRSLVGAWTGGWCLRKET